MKRQYDPAANPVDHGLTKFLRSSRNRRCLAGLILVAAVVIAYLPVWHAGFIWDDDAHLTNNPCIIGPLGFKEIWTSGAAVYYPLVLTSFWIQHALWGLMPLPYHLVNIALHAACAVLLWRLLRGLDVPGAWLAAALWALHPVQAESVAWIAELKNTQSCLFYLLTIRCFLKWRAAGAFAGRRGTEWDYALTLLYATLAMLSKTSTVMLPVVLGLCWWWTDKRWRWRNLFRLSPFLLISAAASGWTIWEQKFHSGALGPEWAQSWPERFVIAGKAVWFYLAKLAWPHPLIFIYPRWTVDASRPAAYLPLVAVAVALVATGLNRNGRARPVFFAFAYFLVLLFPVLGFFKVYFFRYSFVGDHFQYLAGIGPLTLGAAAIATLLERHKRRAPSLKPIVYGTLILGLGVLTWRQCGKYRNLETLWRTTLAENPDTWLAQNNLGDIVLHNGQVEEAIEYYRKALEIRPDYEETYNNLGYALYLKGQLDQAIPCFQKALEIRPDFATAHNNLGNALFRKGQVDEAIAHYQKAVEIQPDYANAHINLGSALLQKGRMDEAIAHYQAALRIQPDFAGAYNNLCNIAWLLATCPDASVRNGAKAVELAQQADRVSGGNDPAVLGVLAAAYAEAGRFTEAVAAAQRALQLATARANTALADDLRMHLGFYRAGSPFRDAGLSNAPAAPAQP